jgi:glc operon protein GlcG
VQRVNAFKFFRRQEGGMKVSRHSPLNKVMSIFSKGGAFAILLAAMVAYPQQTPNPYQMPDPYGAPVSLDNAKKAAAAVVAEATKNGWTMVVAIVDPDGTLIFYEKMDNTQLGSAKVAIDKARSAALFKRPTRAFEDLLGQGSEGARYLKMEGAIPIEGGIPLVMDGKIVGAIGVSGGKSAQDAHCAQLGADALK